MCETGNKGLHVPVMELTDDDLVEYLTNGFVLVEGDPSEEDLLERLRIEKVRRDLGI